MRANGELHVFDVMIAGVKKCLFGCVVEIPLAEFWVGDNAKIGIPLAPGFPSFVGVLITQLQLPP